MIEIERLAKSYGEVRALRGISARIERGEIVGLLGPNGAGKTTTMKLLVGYLLPTAGSARVAGHDVVADPIAVQQRIGYLPENAPIYSEMIVEDYLRFMADMRGVARTEAPKRIGRAIEECGLERVVQRPISQLSKGYRQRTGLAGVILHEPEILVLDEPTTGLDPNQIVDVRRLIRRMGETKTIILSTHILSEVEATCDRAVIIVDGEIRADGSLESLTRSHAQVVRLRCDDATGIAEWLAGLDGVARVQSECEEDGTRRFRLDLTTADEAIAGTIFREAAARGWELRELRRDDKTLEQVFRELTEVAA